MKKFTERDFLTNDILTAYEDGPIVWTLIWSALLALTFSMLPGIPLDMLLMGEDGWGLLVGAVVGAIIGGFLPHLGRLYAGNGMDASLLYEARYYFKLPKADRAMYPTGIIDALKDDDLTSSEIWALNEAMSDLRREIGERNEARRLIMKRSVDVEDITTRLREARAHVAVETETFKELGF